jgi:hypothetical protein
MNDSLFRSCASRRGRLEALPSPLERLAPVLFDPRPLFHTKPTAARARCYYWSAWPGPLAGAACRDYYWRAGAGVGCRPGRASGRGARWRRLRRRRRPLLEEAAYPRLLPSAALRQALPQRRRSHRPAGILHLADVRVNLELALQPTYTQVISYYSVLCYDQLVIIVDTTFPMRCSPPGVIDLTVPKMGRSPNGVAAS